MVWSLLYSLTDSRLGLMLLRVRERRQQHLRRATPTARFGLIPDGRVGPSGGPGDG